MKASRHKIYDTFAPMYLDGCDSFAIPLVSKGVIVHWTLVDIAQAEYLLQFKYRIYLNSGKLYARRTTDKQPVHRLVMGDPPEDYVIDHINGDSLDNTRSNLRFATPSQNAQNRPKLEGTSSKYIGVTRTPAKWAVSISHDSKNTYLGTFDDEVEAGQMYDAHALRIYGEFARTNGLLSQEEIRCILRGVMPPEFEVYRPQRELPVNISRTDKGYKVQISRYNETYVEACNTLEQAVELKDEILRKIKKKSYKRIPKTIRNAEGKPIIKAIRKGEVIDVIVNEHTWRELNEISWSISKGYARTRKVMGEYFMHRYLWVRYKGEIPEGMSIDHINNNRLDNRLLNLRLATPSLQAHNRETNSSPIDKYRGVQFRWPYFYVTAEGCTKNDFYTTLEAAAVRANKLYKEKYGKDARLNKVDRRVKTTCWTRIPREMITEDFVKSLTRIQDVICVVKVLKMDAEQGGRYNLMEFKKEHVETAKVQILEHLGDSSSLAIDSGRDVNFL